MPLSLYYKERMFCVKDILSCLCDLVHHLHFLLDVFLYFSFTSATKVHEKESTNKKSNMQHDQTIETTQKIAFKSHKFPVAFSAHLFHLLEWPRRSPLTQM